MSVALTLLAAPAASALPKGTKVQTYEGGLSFPIDMAWVEGTNKIFFTEKNSGKIRVMLGRRLLKKPCVNLDVLSSGERGLLGIALHPRFKKNHLLYVFHTNASPQDNRVTRFEVRRNQCKSPKTIISGISASSSGYHNGGQIEFVKGDLFVATGDAHSPSTAQDTSGRLGKILRLNPNGSVPSGNPFGNAVWSYGHRNPFGLAKGPNGQLYETENGPECNDELNLIKKGRNYGWGPAQDASCSATDGPNPKAPLRNYSNVIVPTDPVWYEGKLKALSGTLLLGDFNGNLRRFRLNDKGTRIRSEKVIHSTSGIVDVAKGPGGWPYFLTTSGIFRIVEK